ncbi:MAG: diguanylate cyclase [Myxococcota bacterium]
MPEFPLRPIMQRRRLRRAGWLLTLGVTLALFAWAPKPTGPTTALVAAMATLTTLAVIASRQDPLPRISPFLTSFATIVVGLGLVLISPPGQSRLVTVTLFSAALPTFGGLGVTWGGALAAWLLIGGASPESLSIDQTAPLLAVLVASVAAGRHFEQVEQTDLEARHEQAQVSWALARRAQTDALTRLPNRPSVQAWLDEAFTASQQSNTWLALLVVDIDHFKRVNDTWGHPTGDRSLEQVARAIQGVLRPGDVAGRWGGEEFLVVLAPCSPDALAHVAERLRAAVQAIELVAPDGAPVPLTVSVGGAATRGATEATAYTLLGAADQALYEAKEGGRNRVCLCERSFVGESVHV